MLRLDPNAPLPAPTTDYEADALAFCRAWLGGQPDFVLHTSGSTGTPKPITLTRAQMQASARLTATTFGLRPGDAALCCLNIHYVAGLMMLVRGLELGLPLLVVEPSANPLAGLPTTTSVAFAAVVPLQLQTILDAADEAQRNVLNGMKALLVGGAATSPGLERAIQSVRVPVFATYGMTETVSHVAIRPLNGPARSELFTALNGVQLGVDARNCLHITAAATNFQRVQTNDVVDLLTGQPNHNVVGTAPARSGAQQFRLLGRADAIVNSGGLKLHPEQIERIMQRVLAQRSGGGGAPRLFVAGRPDERLGQRLVAFVEGQALGADQQAAIRAALTTEIGPYAVPKEYVTITTFAETPTGKLDRNRTVAQHTAP